MNLFKLSRKNVTLLILCTLFMFCIGLIVSYIVGLSDNLNSSKLDDNWHITINNESFNKVSLSDFSFNNTNTGDNITMKCLLPDEHIDNPSIALKLFHSVIDVYINNNIVYSYGHNYADNKQSVGSGYHVISLPDGYEGQEILINIKVLEINSFPNIEPPIFINEYSFSKYIIRTNILDILVAIFLIMVGIIAISISLLHGRFRGEFRKLFWIGAQSLTVASWTMSYCNFTEILTGSYKVAEFFEFFGLFGIAPTTLMIIYESSSSNNIFKKLPRIVATLFIPFILTIIIFNFTHTAHVPLFLFTSHVYTGISIVVAFINITNNLNNKKKSEILLMYALIVEIIMAIIEIARFNLIKYISNTSYELSFFPLTMAFFVIMMFLSYVQQYKEFIEEMSEKKILVSLAYEDSLTGLSNRAKCEDFMTEHASKNIINYAVINFDLNNLKIINDTLGHIKGDEYIQNFVSILKETFQDNSFVGRMGGDEFIAIIYNNIKKKDRYDLVDSTVITANILSMIEKANKINVSFAYGYTISSTDNPLNIREAYRKADYKMYQCKQKQKNKQQ